jgi:hypothetical protein
MISTSWSEWHALFRPFGRALAALFSRRLQQLNVPLSSLDTSREITSAVLQLREPLSGKVVQTAWVRELVATKNTLYAGSYSVCHVPGYPGPCVKVVFPLPNGNAIVLMKPEPHQDGSFSLTSAGERFGDPGFYFVVHEADGRARARYVPSLKETLRVYDSEEGAVRTDHVLRFWGVEFLRFALPHADRAEGASRPLTLWAVNAQMRSLPSPQPVDFPAITLGWFAWQFENRQRLALLGHLPPQFLARLSLPVQRLRDRGRPAHFAQRQNLHMKFAAIVFHPQHIADAHVASRLGRLSVGFDPAKFARPRRERTRLEKARRPQPLVDSYAGHALILVS